jgi:HK97 family phage major capsid protein
MPSLLEELRQRRTELRQSTDEVLTRASSEGRDLSPEEWQDYQARTSELREVDDQLEAERDREVAELRAATVRRPGPTSPREPVLTREQSVYDWCQTRGMFQPPEGGRPPSFDRYLRGIVSGDWEGAEQERAMSEGTLTAGGHLVPTPLSSTVIDLARNAMVTNRAGITTVPMTAATLKLARLTGEGSPGWKTENSAITATADLAFDSVLFTARTLTRVVTLSVELFQDADPSSESVIANSFAQQLALELDRAVLRGSGTPPEPKGILNQTGVTLTAHGANGTAITNYDFWLDAVGTVRNNNFEPNAMVQAPRSATSLSKLKEATTNAYLAPPAGLAGIPRLNTKTIPITLTVGTSTDCSEIYTGDWSQCLLGLRTDFQLLFLRERYLADNLQYAFLAFLRADVQLAQPSAFNIDTGVRA